MTIDNVAAAALVPVITGLVQVMKQAGMPSRYAGLCAIAIGILFALVIGLPVAAAILAGTIGGLAASGIYEIPDTFRKQ